MGKFKQLFQKKAISSGDEGMDEYYGMDYEPSPASRFFSAIWYYFTNPFYNLFALFTKRFDVNFTRGADGVMGPPGMQGPTGMMGLPGDYMYREWLKEYPEGPDKRGGTIEQFIRWFHDKLNEEFEPRELPTEEEQILEKLQMKVLEQMFPTEWYFKNAPSAEERIMLYRFKYLVHREFKKLVRKNWTTIIPPRLFMRGGASCLEPPLGVDERKLMPKDPIIIDNSDKDKSQP
jgi:hypothetical protein